MGSVKDQSSRNDPIPSTMSVVWEQVEYSILYDLENPQQQQNSCLLSFFSPLMENQASLQNIFRNHK